MTIPSAITQFEKCTHCVAGVGEEPRALHARQDHQPRRRPWHWLHPQRSGAQVVCKYFNAFPTKMDSCTFMPQTVQQTLRPHFPESQSCRLVQVHNKIWQNYILREIVLILPNHSHDGFLCFLPSQVMIEPGRSLVATAGLLLTRVIGRWLKAEWSAVWRIVAVVRW